jgi:hypothetical protein
MRKAFIALCLAFSVSILCWSQQGGIATPPSPDQAAPTSPAAPPTTPPQTAPERRVVVLKEGTEVKLKFAQSVTSRAARPGQMIEFAVAEPVIVDGVTVIDRGARSIGLIVRSSAAGVVGKGGMMEIRMEALRSHERMVKLKGDDSRAEKRATGKVVGMTVLFGLTGFLLAGGHEVKIPDGTPITARVAEDVEFPVK